MHPPPLIINGDGHRKGTASVNGPLMEVGIVG
jgi:hypothetical protein